ncbi:dihydroceramide fatty acyl 2-hydroxylase FAH1 isoform X1 [Physcomitrium patens]|uniref:dihydroceramide fatty acyl 2-hydroxylase FAH1 isoform X1 n=2 Tax=Physcomitrium patens TaxID=3218 RepID=UPI000D174845|nr:dihydroceramide fatty acyl 2-hydroxylase FAH1-like isoform X1 [Physcomitrium patens]XP_024391478.1 dihydroceramide fatty acyl 2-hydroxylase FAH1-like isoform X1 [Physcomitrium patens]|eukprot:XP_024391477.1 dihydroceramide fatty acyl 2-hydroxylase FAH1-like isoform X1 [Physcomitrella patens]
MRKESSRIFESSVIEIITRCKWWMVPTVWGPVVVWCQVKAMEQGLPTSALPVALLVGFIFWTFLEYVIHRFLFNAKSSPAWRNQLHYVIHGFHLKHPMDADRLVFPPVHTAAIAMIWKLMEFVLTPTWMPSIFGGALFGYICYDLTHYFLHLGIAFTDYLYKLKVSVDATFKLVLTLNLLICTTSTTVEPCKTLTKR